MDIATVMASYPLHLLPHFSTPSSSCSKSTHSNEITSSVPKSLKTFTISSSFSPRTGKPKYDLRRWFHESASKSLKLALSGSLALGLFISGLEHVNAKVGVNKPELLPKEFSTVIDIAGFLSSGQETRLIKEIASLEKDTGYKLRILAQNFPNTPGLAIRDFWNVDDKTIVFVADPTFGNIIHFNVGAAVDLEVPRNFWSRVEGKYGNMFYWKEKGEDASVEGAVKAIAMCLRNPQDPNSCSEVI